MADIILGEKTFRLSDLRNAYQTLLSHLDAGLSQCNEDDASIASGHTAIDTATTLAQFRPVLHGVLNLDSRIVARQRNTYQDLRKELEALRILVLAALDERG